MTPALPNEASAPGAATPALPNAFDALTGLPNRLLFREQVSLVVRSAQTSGRQMAVMLTDIDDFRRIKHSLGHAASEQLIRSVAKRIDASLRHRDFLAGTAPLDRTCGLARIGGNEFAILLTGLHRPHDAQQVAQRLREAVAAGIAIEGGHTIYPTLSAGIALFPGDGESAEALIEHADIALGQAKENGKDRIQFYSQSMDKRAAEWLEIGNAMRHAIERQEMVLHYQPRIDCRNGELRSNEALLRWNHPTRGLLAPGHFLQVAEDSRLIVPIGEWVLEAACRQNRQWQDEGLPPVPVGVNVSALQVCRPDFQRTVARALEQSGLDPKWLELEITESMLIQDAASALRTLTAVKALGVRIAIDDFGTGFSALSYLRDFPFDVLKIDRSFVESLPADTRTAALTCAIIDITRRLGLHVVAEGVETEAQRNFLQANGCHLLQGYLYSRPLDPVALEHFWRGRLFAVATDFAPTLM